MRDLALTAIVLTAAVFALRHTWIGVLLWTWLSTMNPHKLTWGFAQTAPFAQIAAGVTLASIALCWKQLRMPRDPIVLFLALFVGWMCVTTHYAIVQDRSMDRLIAVLKIQLMTFVAFMAIRDRKHIEAFVWVLVISVGFYGFKGGLFTIATGGSGRVWGPPDSYINGNNEIGLALTMVIPLANYLRQVSPHRWVRRGLLLLMLLCAAAVLGTQSRGALLAIAAMAVVLWLRSRRKVVVGVALGVFAALLVAFMPSSWEERMSSIKTYKEDSSAMSRLNAWETAVNIANDRVFGAGFAADHVEVFRQYSKLGEKWVFTAHSIYFQTIGEQGWIGFALFLSIGACTLWSSIWVRRHAKRRPETMWAFEFAGMVQVSMVGYAVGGSFLSLAYLDLPYNIAVAMIACKWWLKHECWKTETQGFLGAGVPVARLPPPPPKVQGA